MENNVYEAPEAELTTSGGEQPVLKMKRFSAWGVFGLGLITGGIYQLYWLFNRAKNVNEIQDNKISNAVIYTFGFSYLLAFILQFAFAAMGDAGLLILGVVSIVYIVAYLVFLFTMRSRLIDITGDGVNPVMTFFFHTIYFQYKINKAYDAAA